MLEVMLELKGAEPLFIISRSHCVSTSNAVFAIGVGLPGIQQFDGWIKSQSLFSVKLYVGFWLTSLLCIIKHSLVFDSIGLTYNIDYV